MKKLNTLRKKYPRFFYQGYSYGLKRGDLNISFDFAVPPGIQFHPTVVIKNVSPRDIKRVGDAALNNLVFHLGLMEIPSYWKATCSPNIVVEAGYLDQDQIRWWKDLILKGMGEYFYQNKIDFTRPNFLTITSIAKEKLEKLNRIKFTNLTELSFGKRTLVPVGGGKDAVVTLELLKKAKMPLRPFLLNPKQEQKAILSLAKVEKPIVVERAIDPKLLELNRKGYLNGHTPFSAYLTFLSVFAAVLFNYKYIALSNERSSNEGNVRYGNKMINHQYSKSFEFEKKFRHYSKKYLVKDIEYFSFLRPLYELQIAKLFARFPKYFVAFLSCNEANKTKSGTQKPTGRWCGKCAKCLFVFLALFPFARARVLKLFGKNLLGEKRLTPLLQELIGEKRFKPFECVGTIRESRAALAMALRAQKSHPLLHAWNGNNFLPAPFAKILRNAVKENRLPNHSLRGILE